MFKKEVWVHIQERCHEKTQGKGSHLQVRDRSERGSSLLILRGNQP